MEAIDNNQELMKQDASDFLRVMILNQWKRDTSDTDSDDSSSDQEQNQNEVLI